MTLKQRFLSIAMLLGVSCVAVPSLALAQSDPLPLPPHYPLNPMAVSRTPLFAQPYVWPSSGWRTSLLVDYGSAIEWEDSVEDAAYVLDAELLRVLVTFSRDLSATRFIQLSADVNGVFNGFSDAAFDWYHDAIGIGFYGREVRPQNEFLYALSLPDGIEINRTRPDYFVGDVRFSYGVRHSGRHQSVAAITVPTSTAPPGYSKEVPSIGLLHTFRAPLGESGSFEATGGVGFTPTHGELATKQERFFNSASAGARLRLFGRQYLHGLLFTHSALYHSTTLEELERREIGGDIGWIGRTSSGREWYLGISEDFGPKDAGIDLIIRFGFTW